MRILISFSLYFSFFLSAAGQSKMAAYVGLSKVLNAKAIKETDYSDEKFPVGSAFDISYLRNSSKQFSFFARAGFRKKGFLRQTAFPDNSFYTKIRINYLYFTPQVSFTFLHIKNSRFIVTAGPYIAVALSGKESGTWITFAGPGALNRNIAFRHSIDYTTEQVQLKPFDFGINSSVVYQIKNYGVMFNWQGGIKNIITLIPFGEFNKKYRNNIMELALFYQVDLDKHKVKKSSTKCASL